MGSDEMSFIGKDAHVRDFTFEVRRLDGLHTGVSMVGMLVKNLETNEERWYPLTPREAEILATDLLSVARSLPPLPEGLGT